MQIYLVAAVAAVAQVAQATPNADPSSVQHRGTIVPKRVGLSGYIGIQYTQAFKQLAPYIGWYSDYSPNTPSVGNVQGVPMLWGASGSPCDGVASVTSAFQQTVATSTPKLMFGFYEPDCYCPDSSQMTVAQAQSDWNSMIVPLGNRGTVLGSPSMCKQYDEDFLTPFNAGIQRSWDVTSIHINVDNVADAQADVQYYRKYGKPIFVSEFACVNPHNGFVPCTNQTYINSYVSQMVSYFNSQSDIIGYGASNGDGLGTVWPLVTTSGGLSATGIAYLNAIKGLKS